LTGIIESVFRLSGYIYEFYIKYLFTIWGDIPFFLSLQPPIFFTNLEGLKEITMRYWLIVLFIFLSSAKSFSAAGRILAISSYGTDYQWSNAVMDAIGERLKSQCSHIEYNREFLSSESFDDPSKWGEKMELLLNNYHNKNLKAIILISDEAWMAYRNVHNPKFKDIPIVLCGVKLRSIATDDFIRNRKTLQLSDFKPTTEVMKDYKATGVLRGMNVAGSLSLINNLVTGLERFVFITDSRFYGIYTRLLLQDEVKKNYPQIPAEYIDARFVSTDSLLSKLSHIPSQTGVLMTSWLTGEYGFESSKDYTYSLMESKLKAPIFITNDIGLEKEFFVGGYFNEASFWGDKAFLILKQVLYGKDPKEITPIAFYDQECHIAWNVFKHYNLDLSKLPAKVTFFNAPLSFWSSFKYYIIGAIGLLVLLLIFHFYTLRSNIKLQNTQRLLVASIDEAKQANVQLNHAKDELTDALHKAEESDRLKSAFLANMSHEIRTPLNAIVGFSGILSVTESEEERLEYVKLIQTNSSLLLQLLSSILDFSKIEAGILDFNFSPVNASDICNSVANTLKMKCHPSVTLDLDLPKDAMHLNTDVDRLMQVLINLVNNAIKFTSKGFIKVGYYSYDDNFVEFFVKDTGKGISQDKQSAIFERFTKLDSYVEGAGLGLSISKTIVEKLGGEIGVHSNEGEGSHFWFRVRKTQRNI